MVRKEGREEDGSLATKSSLVQYSCATLATLLYWLYEATEYVDILAVNPLRGGDTGYTVKQ
jgi:hypothetical protein